jgi:hypothetical protein
MRRDPQGVQVFDRLLGLALVGGAHIEDVRRAPLVQHHRAGRGPDQRHAVRLQQRQHRFGVRRATGQEQRQYPALLDQLARVGGRALRIELVVQRDQLELLAGHAAARALTASNQRRAPSVVSFTPAATGPVKPAVCPIRICPCAPAPSAQAPGRPSNDAIHSSLSPLHRPGTGRPGGPDSAFRQEV